MFHQNDVVNMNKYIQLFLTRNGHVLCSVAVLLLYDSLVFIPTFPESHDHFRNFSVGGGWGGVGVR